jgi:glycosyltransferase involved in cell wall biosynthesis
MDFISVILPVYNCEKYLGKCIESVLNQTYGFFELIIVNDGSSDSTEEIINGFIKKDNRIVYIYKENSGIVDSLNMGISFAKHNIIARMDADDVCNNDRFEIQIDYMSQFDIVGSNVVLIDSKDDILYDLILPEKKDLMMEKIEKHMSFLVHPAVMFKLNSLKKNDLGQVYSKEYKHVEDLELWIRNLYCCKFYNIQKPLLQLRKHDKNISLISFDLQLINSLILINFKTHNIEFCKDDFLELSISCFNHVKKSKFLSLKFWKLSSKFSIFIFLRRLIIKFKLRKYFFQDYFVIKKNKISLYLIFYLLPLSILLNLI